MMNDKLFYNDELFPNAVAVILQSRVVSAGRLQSALQIGSVRAIKLLDEMEQLGIIGPTVGNMQREIFLTFDQWQNGAKNNFALQKTEPVKQPNMKNSCLCKYCRQPMQSESSFCPSCGKQVSKKKRSPLFGLGMFFAIVAVFLSVLVSAPSTDPAQKSISKSEYIKMCKSIDYASLARNPNSYKGQYFTFTGEVVQVLQKGNGVNLRVNVTEETLFDSIFYTDTIYVVAFLHEDGDRILEGDIITLYGECMGLHSYTTVLGDQASIPRIDAEYWNLE